MPPRRALEDAQSTGLLDRVKRRLGALGAGVGRAYTRLSPLLGLASDVAWFVGTSALLVTLPVLVEIQRETTVLVLQRQREVEMAQMQEQARAQHGGVVEQVKGFGALIAAAAGGTGGGEQQR